MMKIHNYPSPLTGEGGSEGDIKNFISPSPSSPPTRGGEILGGYFLILHFLNSPVGLSKRMRRMVIEGMICAILALQY